MELSVLGVSIKLPAFEEFRNIDPAVAIGFVGIKEQFLLLLGPGLLVNLGVELVVPPILIHKLPLSTLFPRSSHHIVFLSHQRAHQWPVFQPDLLNDLHYCLVLLAY